MAVVYFKTDTSRPFMLSCTADGRIDFFELGQKCGLDPSSIDLNEIRYPKEGLKSEVKWEQIEEVFKQHGLHVGTKDDPVMVTGEAAVSTEGESSPKKRKSSPAELPFLDLEAVVAGEASYMRKLLKTPSKLPIGVPELLEFLSTKSEPLPAVSPNILYSVMDKSLVRLYSPAQAAVAVLVDYAYTANLRHPKNEADSSHKLRNLTGDFLEGLNELAPENLQLLHLETTMGSARNPSSASASTALVDLMRPDFTLYLRDALILRWENKIESAHFPSALEENIEKLKIWSPLYYGELPFVIGGCCGGRKFQWLRLSPSGKNIRADPISKLFDLHMPRSVLELLHSVVQMHRLLQKLQEKLTTAVPVRLYKEIKRVSGTVLLGPELVVKTLVPGLASERVDFLQSLYESISGSKHLIQLKGKIKSTGASTKLNLYPVGHPNGRPTCLTELRNATHDILRGLVVLHEAGYTHRDLRWENCIREIVQGEWKWIIIDLEFAGRDQDLWEHARLVNWDAETLEATKSYTKGSDMYELGKLIVNWLDESYSEDSDEGKQIRALAERLKKDRGEAAEASLGDMCLQGCARCAIFNS